LRDGIIAQAVAADPNRITLIQSDGHFRPRLCVLGLLVSVFVCRYWQDGKSNPRWILTPVSRHLHATFTSKLRQVIWTALVSRFSHRAASRNLPENTDSG
jgi:hypothetical protein